MNNITVFIIEDDTNTIKRYFYNAKQYPHIDIVGHTNSSRKAIGLVNKHSPDVVILDLGLHNGEGSGISFLHSINNKTISYKPYILAVTDNPSSATLNMTQNLGVDFTIKKYQENFSESLVFEHISMLSFSDILKLNSHEDIQTPAIKNLYERYTEEIRKELDDFGIRRSTSGYTYIVDAVLFVIDNPSIHYTYLFANKYNKKPDTIKKAMERAITTAWSDGSKGLVANHTPKYLTAFYDGFTIKEFIKFLSEQIRTNIQ